jgi:hypothetical protein
LKIPSSINKIGIFGFLIDSQRDMFKRNVVISQSSYDIYSVIDEKSNDSWGLGHPTIQTSKEWIQFEFPDPISINALSIMTGDRNFLRSWSFSSRENNGEWRLITERKDDDSLNGAKKEMKISLPERVSKAFRIEQTSLNWSNTVYFHIRNVELFSNDIRSLIKPGLNQLEYIIGSITCGFQNLFFWIDQQELMLTQSGCDRG